MHLFVDSRFINDSDEFGKMFVAGIALSHAFKKRLQMLLSSSFRFHSSYSSQHQHSVHP